MSATKVYIAAINDAKNGNQTLKRVELRMEIEKPATTASGKIGFLLAGATGPKGVVAPNIEKRVCWENISNDNIAKWGLKVGSILEDAIKTPCKITILETTEPQYTGHTPKINPSTNEIESTISLGENYHPSLLEINPTGETLYYGGDWIISGIFSLSISSTSKATTPFIDGYFYGFNVDPKNGIIYGLQSPSFTTSGTLSRYSSTGALLGTYTSGVGPNGTYFAD